MWITNGPIAETLVVYAKTDPAAGPARHQPAFIIEKRHEGIFPPRKSSTSSACAVPTPGELVFENCEVPEEKTCSAEVGPRASNVLMSGLDYERAGAGRGSARDHAGLPRRG